MGCVVDWVHGHALGVTAIKSNRPCCQVLPSLVEFVCHGFQCRGLAWLRFGSGGECSSGRPLIRLWTLAVEDTEISSFDRLFSGYICLRLCTLGLLSERPAHKSAVDVEPLAKQTSGVALSTTVGLARPAQIAGAISPKLVVGPSAVGISSLSHWVR